MKIVLSIAMCFLFINSYSQKIYISKEGVVRLNKKIEACKLLEKRLAYTNNQVSQLRCALIEKEIEHEEQISKLDSIIANAENDFVELQKKYERALELIPKRKRRKL